MIKFKINRIPKKGELLDFYELVGQSNNCLGWFLPDIIGNYYYHFPEEDVNDPKIDSQTLLSISSSLSSLNIDSNLSSKLEKKDKDKTLTWQEVFDIDPLT